MKIKLKKILEFLFLNQLKEQSVEWKPSEQTLKVFREDPLHLIDGKLMNLQEYKIHLKSIKTNGKENN